MFVFSKLLHYLSLDIGSVHFAALFSSGYGEGMAGFGDAIKTDWKIRKLNSVFFSGVNFICPKNHLHLHYKYHN